MRATLLRLAGLLVAACAVCRGQVGLVSLEQLLETRVTSVFRNAQNLSKAAAAIFVINREDIRREDPFGAILGRALEGKFLNGRPFLIQRFKPGQNVSGCQVLFISPPVKSRYRSIAESLASTGSDGGGHAWFSPERGHRQCGAAERSGAPSDDREGTAPPEFQASQPRNHCSRGRPVRGA